MSGIFAGAQLFTQNTASPRFPLVAIRNLLSNATRGSAALAVHSSRRIGAASGLGFMTNARNRITLLDYDARDERGFADALARHGNTPLKVRTASGKFHAYYQHKGERRFIRGLR